jgi:hypothetical protein
LKDESQAPSIALDLPLINLPTVHPCSGCGECCTYIATQIDNPSTFREYENIYWYLTHENVGVYIDWDNDWYLEFQTKCRNLTEARTCGIYIDRPVVCSEFSWQDCERNSGEQGWKHYFKNYEDLLGWMQAKRPKAFARYAKKRGELLEERERSAASRARSSGPARSASRPSRR